LRLWHLSAWPPWRRSRRGPPLPYSGSTFKGRILFSHDGNYNDEDDWGAFPVAIAILDAMGLKSKLVHAHFNNVLTFKDAAFAAQMRTSALGAQQRYGLSRFIFYDSQHATERTNAINSIRDEINRSTADDPLYMLLAGPMDPLCRHSLIQAPAVLATLREPFLWVVCVSSASSSLFVRALPLPPWLCFPVGLIFMGRCCSFLCPANRVW